MGCYFSWVMLHISGSMFHKIWAISFITLSLGALLGGISHGFGPMLSKVAKMIIWRLTLLFIGLTALVLLFSVLMIITNGEINIRILPLFVILFGYYNYKVYKNDSFSVAVKFYLPCIVISLACFLYVFVVYSSSSSSSSSSSWCMVIDPFRSTLSIRAPKSNSKASKSLDM